MGCNNDADMISDLPDDIIFNILCFLPLKESASTSVLSSRWKHLWKHLWVHTSILIFDFRELNTLRCETKYTEFVTSAIKSHKAPYLKKLTISLFLLREHQNSVSSWFGFALSKRVEQLELDFRYRDPHNILVGEVLKENNLHSCEFEFLKELSLSGVIVSGEDIKLILTSFTSLEVLNLRARVTSELNIVSGRLRHLSLSCNKGCSYSMRVCTSNLASIRFKLSSFYNKLILEDVPQLVEAKFTIIRELWYPSIMPTLKKLSLTYSRIYHNSIPLACFLEASPCREVFRLEIGSSCGRLRLEVPGERSPHYHLKVFEFLGFHDDDYHANFLRYIVVIALFLREFL